MFGLVIVTERVWKTDQKSYVRMLGAAIGVTPKGRSARLKRVLTDFGCEHSFQHAAARVKEHYGFEIGFSAVRDTTLEVVEVVVGVLEVVDEVEEEVVDVVDGMEAIGSGRRLEVADG